MDPTELATTGVLSDVPDDDRGALAAIMRLEEQPTPVRVAVAMGWDVRDLLDGRPGLQAALEAEAGKREVPD